jgi:hypothetical protein
MYRLEAHVRGLEDNKMAAFTLTEATSIIKQLREQGTTSSQILGFIDRAVTLFTETKGSEGLNPNFDLSAAFPEPGKAQEDTQSSGLPLRLRRENILSDTLIKRVRDGTITNVQKLFEAASTLYSGAFGIDGDFGAESGNFTTWFDQVRSRMRSQGIVFRVPGQPDIDDESLSPEERAAREAAARAAAAREAGAREGSTDANPRIRAALDEITRLKAELAKKMAAGTTNAVARNFADLIAAQQAIIDGIRNEPALAAADDRRIAEQDRIAAEAQAEQERIAARQGEIVNETIGFLQTGALDPDRALEFIQRRFGLSTEESQVIFNTIRNQRQRLLEQQGQRDVFLRGAGEAFGQPVSDFTPFGQRALSSGFNRFQDINPITNFFPQQEQGQAFQSFLGAPRPTRAGLQTNIDQILNAANTDPTGQQQAIFQASFGTPEQAASAASQPFLAGVAPRLRSSLGNILQNQFASQLALNPEQFQTRDQIAGIFNTFRNQGF